MYKILALDGGGLRSVFQARLIARLEAALGKSLKPDLYAGTSGGSIVACGLQTISPSDIVSFFQSQGSKIFKKEGFLDEIDDLWNLTGAKYYNKQLKQSLTHVFKNLSVIELPTRTLITAFHLRHEDGNWQPVVFHNFPGPKAAEGLSVVDAIMRSAAAPTYFPVYQDHCDGGVWGNNPSTSALAAACDAYIGGQAIKDVVCFSIGTGQSPLMLQGAKRDLGAADWFKKGLIEVLLDANVEASHYYTRSLLGVRYHRVQVNLQTEIKLDDPDAVPKMIAYAESVDLVPVLDWLQGFWV